MGRGAQGVVDADAREGSPVCEQVGTGGPGGESGEEAEGMLQGEF